MIVHSDKNNQLLFTSPVVHILHSNKRLYYLKIMLHFKLFTEIRKTVNMEKYNKLLHYAEYV